MAAGKAASTWAVAGGPTAVGTAAEEAAVDKAGNTVALSFGLVTAADGAAVVAGKDAAAEPASAAPAAAAK